MAIGPFGVSGPAAEQGVCRASRLELELSDETPLEKDGGNADAGRRFLGRGTPLRTKRAQESMVRAGSWSDGALRSGPDRPGAARFTWAPA